VRRDLDLEQVLGVVAVAQLDDRQHAPHLGLQLGVPEQDDVVGDEGESVRELERRPEEPVVSLVNSVVAPIEANRPVSAVR
jgi:hypothetical protein